MSKTIRSEGQDALCKALVAARTSAGLSQAKLAERLKCHQSLIARIESGERRIDVIEAVVLARAIGISIIDLATAVEEGTPDDHRI